MKMKMPAPTNPAPATPEFELGPQQPVPVSGADRPPENAEQTPVNWKALGGLADLELTAPGVAEAASDTGRDGTVRPDVSMVLGLLQMPWQYTVPYFRRHYCWGPKQWVTLWDNVLAAARTGRPHYLGTLAYVVGADDDVETAGGVSLIDGQQRLVTVALLLIAIARSLQPSGSFTVKDGEVTVTVSATSLLDFLRVGGSQQHRLVLKKPGHETLNWLIDRLSDPCAPRPAELSTGMLEALSMFERQLAASGVDAATVYAGLQQLQVVCLVVTRSPGAGYPVQTVHQVVNSLHDF